MSSPPRDSGNQVVSEVGSSEDSVPRSDSDTDREHPSDVSISTSSSSRKKGKGRASDTDIRNPVIKLADPVPGEDPSLAQHPGVICCGASCPQKTPWIQGVRYKCSVCEQQDFCRYCISQPDSGHDTTHAVYECIGPSEFKIIDAWRLTTRDVVFKSTPSDGVEDILSLGDYSLSDDIKRLTVGPQVQPPLIHVPRSATEPPVVGVEHQQDPALLAKIWLGKVSKYTYSGCQLRDFPGPRPAIARLLELKPGATGEKLECEFKLTRFDDNPTYEVICCKWKNLALTSNLTGTSILAAVSRKHAIYVDEKHFLEVDASLYQALIAFRDPVKAKMLWIEELCVDQPHEKRFHNRSRGLIMSRASQVFMWAGEAHDDVEEVFGLVMQLAHYCNSDDASLLRPELLSTLDLPPVSADVWHSLFRFFTQEVVQTHWELEDLSFAKDPTLLCGEYRLDWWDVVGVAKMLAQPPWSNLSDPLGIGPMVPD